MSRTLRPQAHDRDVRFKIAYLLTKRDLLTGEERERVRHWATAVAPEAQLRIAERKELHALYERMKG